jgi:nicotinate-nucleotide pyrophosphorylase (carboxylating)
MDKSLLVQQCFQRGEMLTRAQPLYRACLTDLLSWMLAADGVKADQTIEALNLTHNVSAVVYSKQPGIIAGIEEATFLLERHTGIVARPCCPDGSAVRAGEEILSLSGDVSEILPFERTVLNIIGRMSGIATHTYDLVSLARNTHRAGDGPFIAATRKAPWMLLDKKAVYCGGGLTHRLSLADGILIKDNHLAVLKRQTGSASIEEAIRQAVGLALAAPTPADSFEIEVETAAQGIAALSAFEEAVRHMPTPPAMIIMLDNFDPQEATAFIDEIRGCAICQRILFEASGDITEANLSLWANTGADVLSLGALTHSVKAFNVSMGLDQEHRPDNVCPD